MGESQLTLPQRIRVLAACSDVVTIRLSSAEAMALARKMEAMERLPAQVQAITESVRLNTQNLSNRYDESLAAQRKFTRRVVLFMSAFSAWAGMLLGATL